LLWLALDPGSFDWRSVATLVAWFMSPVIQRAVHRETQSDESSVDVSVGDDPHGAQARRPRMLFAK
jgi:hypothetical protein